MANPFDQFDAPVKNNTATSNPFDQFDNPGAAGEPSPHQIYTSEGIPMGDPVHIPRDAPVTKETKPEIPVTSFEPYNPEVHGEIIKGEQQKEGTVVGNFLHKAFVENPKKAYSAVKGVLPENTQKVLGVVESAVDNPISNASKGFFGGLANAPRNIVESAVSAIPEGSIRSAGESVLSQWPEYKPEGTAETIGETIGEISFGAFGGTSLAGKLLPAATGKVSKILRGAGKFLAGETGAVATIDKDTKPTFLGDNAEFSWLRGWGFDEKGSVTAQVFERKANLLIEGIAASIGVDAATRAVSKAWSVFPGPVVKGVNFFFSKNSQEEWLVEQLIRVAGDLPDDATPEQIKATMDEIMKLVSDPNNKRTLIKYSEIDPSLADKAVKKDTLSVIQDMLAKNPDNDNLVGRLGKLRNAGGGSRVDSVLEAPMKELDEGLGNISKVYAERGGNVDDAASGIVQAADDKFVKPAQEKLGTLRAQKDDIAQYLVDEMNNNPEFISIMGRLDKNVKLDKERLTREKAMGLIARTQDKISDMVSIKNQNFEDIGKFGVVGNKNIIDRSYKNLSNTAKEILTKKGVITQIEESGLGILELQKIANFDISDIEQYLRGQDRHTVAKEILSFKNALTFDQLDYLDKSKKAGSGPAARAIKKAYDYFKGPFAPIRENPVLDMISTSRFEKGVKSLAKPLDEFGRLLSPSGMGQPLYFEDLARFINANMGDKEAKELGDIVITKMGEDLQSLINSNQIVDSDSLLGVITTWEKYGAALQAASPERAKNLDEFLTKIRDGVVDTDKLEEVIGLATKEVEQASKYVYDDLLKGFAGRDGSIPNSYNSFKNFFKQSGNEAKLDQILSLAEGNPQVKEGIKKAYIDSLRDTFLDSGGRKTASKVKEVNLTNIANFTDKQTSIFRYGEKILSPEELSIVDELSQMVYGVKASTGREQALGFHQGDVQGTIAAAARTAMTHIFGVLNPTAARINTVTSTYLKSHSATPYIKEFTDIVLSDIDTFAEVVARLQRKSIPFVGPEEAKILRRVLAKSAMYSDEQSEIGTTDQQTEEVFNNNQKE